MTQSVQLLGISNAIVDVLAHVDENFLKLIGAPLGSMTLIDEARAHEIYDMMGPATEMSGGSVANTIAGFAILGGSASYIGRVRNDQLGEIFVHDMRSLGVDVRTLPVADGAPTARSHILIDPDGQRTMQTYLGACTELGVSDVTEETVGTPKVILLEGYVWDIPEGPALAAEAIRIAKQNGSAVALSLSDSYCVERHRDAFAKVVRDDVDMVFADDDEVMALYEVDKFEDVLSAIDGSDKLFVMTRSEKGSVIVAGDTKIVQEANAIEQLIDTTGAGDAYAAAFLYGWANDKSLDECARLGTHVATSVIQQLGARIETNVLESYQ
ncbi:MAG: adenosine kinase [Proteobacteria bacterium]|nr:adenosine kinase [Pseudomonadota bacterium]